MQSQLTFLLLWSLAAAKLTQCPRGGKNCKDVNITDDCKNGGMCCNFPDPTPQSYRCLCKPGYAGNKCQLTVNDGSWMTKGQDELNIALGVKTNMKVAKNVILFIGDGMSMPTITASRIYKGQQKGKTGEEESLVFDTFPHTGLSKTYNVNHQVTDSAAAAVALLGGQKVNYGTLGLNSNVVRYDCGATKGNEIETIIKWSQDEGKRTGEITTARVTHATPAAGYANCAARDWESDYRYKDQWGFDYADIAKEHNCSDIAWQFVHASPGNKMNVLMGGGRRNFLPDTMNDPEEPSKFGERKDGRNLAQEWVNLKKQSGDADKSQYVWNKSQFDAVDATKTDYLFGLFERSHIAYYSDGKDDPKRDPTLEELTDKAIDVLNKGDKGYFLMVEGARIDQAHHEGKARKALEETLEFEKAIQKAMDKTDEKDTLIVVTADHSHIFFMGGYPGRGNDILGLIDTIDIEPSLDGHPRTVLGYGDGPGAENRTARPHINIDEITKYEYRQQAMVLTLDESHGGDDVPIYAYGPMSHLFSGVHEMNYIAHAMAYASCVGSNQKHCGEVNDEEKPPAPCNAPKAVTVNGLLILALIIVGLLK